MVRRPPNDDTPVTKSAVDVIRLNTLVYIFSGIITVLFAASGFFAERWFNNINNSATEVANALQDVKGEIKELSVVIKYLNEQVQSTSVEVKLLQEENRNLERRLIALEAKIKDSKP